MVLSIEPFSRAPQFWGALLTPPKTQNRTFPELAKQSIGLTSFHQRLATIQGGSMRRGHEARRRAYSECRSRNSRSPRPRGQHRRTWRCCTRRGRPPPSWPSGCLRRTSRRRCTRKCRRWWRIALQDLQQRGASHRQHLDTTGGRSTKAGWVATQYEPVLCLLRDHCCGGWGGSSGSVCTARAPRSHRGNYQSSNTGAPSQDVPTQTAHRTPENLQRKHNTCLPRVVFMIASKSHRLLGSFCSALEAC